MDEAARSWGGFSLDDERLVFVHLLLYGYDMKAPSLEDTREWAEHYGLDERANHVVLVGDPRLISSETFRMIPGLMVVDHDFVLRFDGTGRRPPHDLWTVLLPGVRGMLDES